MKGKHAKTAPFERPTDREALWLVMTAVMNASNEIRLRRERAQKAEERLREAADAKTWELYLELDERITERVGAEIELIARWAMATEKERRRIAP